MKFRTFLFVVVLLGAVVALTFFSLRNGEILFEERIDFGGGYFLTVGFTMILFFAAGATLVFAWGASQEFGTMIERWRLRKESRRSEEIEEEYSRGLVAVLEGRETEAIAHFRAVLERNSRHVNTLLKLGEVLRARGQVADAIEYHRKAHHINEENTRPLYALVEDHEAAGDIDRARAVLGAIIGINKNSVAAWRKLRSLHLKQGNWEKALEAHERVDRLSDPDAPRDAADRQFGDGVRYEMAKERLAEGKSREATAMLRKLVKQQPQFIPAYVKLGEALAAQGQEAAALATWTEGFEASGSPIFLTLLEEYHLGREEPLAAIEALKQCIVKARKDTLPRFYLGKLYFRLEMLDDALSVLTSLEGVATYAPTLHYLLGRIHERRDNHREAAREYRKVIRELDLVQLDYECQACRERTMEWSDRCPSCGRWNVVEVNFREEITLDELGLSAAPIYTSRT